VSSELWIPIALLGAGALALVAYLVRLVRQGREADRSVDYSKLREWDEDDDWK
jgi:hypothetical protein